MRNIKLLALTFITALSTSIWAQTGQYSTRTISTDGKTSTWVFNVVSGSAKTIPDGTDDNGVIYVNGSGSNKAQTSAYMSFNKSEIYLEVPSGSAGSISMEVYSSSDSRWFQLYINTTEGPATQRLWSKAGDGTDGKKGPQSFTFASTDITTKNAKTYLYLKTNGTEMKVKSFTITLTSGSYSGGPAPASTDATLSSIVYGAEQTPVPGFAADQLSYEVELPADYVGGAPSIQGTPTDPNANITNVTQATTIPGVASITVTAEDGTTTKTYTVTFTKASADPKVLAATWANIKGTAAIDQVNKTITGQVTNGSSLTLAPTFTGNNIDRWTPIEAQDFSTGVKNYVFFSSSTESTQYAVTITEAPAVSTDATLKSLTYGGTSVPNFSPSTLTYNIELTNGIKTPPTIAAVANDTKATVAVTQAQSVPGTGKVEVTAEDGTTKLTYTINYTVKVPVSGLSIHVPEIYEAPTLAGGYNTPLTALGAREYEVYYTERTADGDFPTFSTTTVTDGKTDGISGSTSKTKNEGRPGDKWFEGTIYSASECKSASSQDEFVFVTKGIREHRLGGSNTYQFHVKGFDQFSLWGMDKKLDPKNGNQVFVVKVDGVEQPTDASLYNTTQYTIRRYDISTGEHLIEISTTCTSSNVCYMGGFSLRVAQEPRTKYLKGNDSTQVVMQTAALKPVTYVTKYNNIPGGETRLEWIGTAANGVELTKIDGELTDTLVLGGNANCATGVYNYAVVAYYNGVETSRATGTFTVKSDIKATSELEVDVYNNEEMDQITFKYYALSGNDVILSWPNGQPTGISGSGNNGKYIIGGTPNISGTLPQTFPYTITVNGADTIISGKIIVKELNYGTNPVLYLYKNNLAYEKDGVYKYLESTGKMSLITRKQKEDGLRPADQYARYKWIIISEDVDANNEEVLKVMLNGGNLPVLNLKGFTYSYQINEDTPNGWGEPDNGAIDTTTQTKKKNGCQIKIEQPNHPIFSKMNGVSKNAEIAILDDYEQHGVMPIRVTRPGTLCLATGYTRSKDNYFEAGELQTAIHEVPASMNGGKKYICLSLARNVQLSAQGRKLIDGIVEYLTTNTQSPVEVPTCQITKFTVAGIDGVIDQATHKIVVNMSVDEYTAADSLIGAEPTIVLADPINTIVIPDSKELRYAAMGLPKKYTVTDYITQTIYEVSIRLYTPQGLEETYESGMWVNIFDIYGRKVATTNEDIYTMDLPRGMYIVVTENGSTLKIMR